MSNAFGDIIREWRDLRRLSQLQLSLEAGMSARHLSFLESGRSRPSRAMVLRLTDALAMPKETANRALHSAGFAPVYPALPFDDKALEPVRNAVKMMLDNHAPFPGVAIDRWWNITDANHGAAALFAAVGIEGSANMLEVMLELGDGSTLENWEDNALIILSRLKSEIIHYGGDDKLENFADRFARHSRLQAFKSTADYSQAVVPTVLRLEDVRLSLFSTIAHFGSVQDIGASDIRIELMFPADEATRDYFKGG
ncbi:helix-turn-helix domain-containing protein [Hyphococcus sp.]|uniref:helix-turn-helix domain-containing protein n=1 Tax=Hyphococcus sp. TaxID=2038636 RepID=UPI0035C6D86D